MSVIDGTDPEAKTGEEWVQKLETERAFLTDGTFFYCCVKGTFYLTKRGRPTPMSDLGYDRDAIAREFERRDLETIPPHDFLERIAPD